LKNIAARSGPGAGAGVRICAEAARAPPIEAILRIGSETRMVSTFMRAAQRLAFDLDQRC
jgi:hypothetical protein